MVAIDLSVSRRILRDRLPSSHRFTFGENTRTREFVDGHGANAIDFEAGSFSRAPVAGLRPSRAGRSMTEKQPNPLMATCSPRLAASMIVAKTELTTSFALALEMSSASATASASSVAIQWSCPSMMETRIGVFRSAGCRRRLAWHEDQKLIARNRIAGSRAGSAPFRRRSLFAGHAERDADARRLLTRCALCSLESFRNLCGGSCEPYA